MPNAKGMKMIAVSELKRKLDRLKDDVAAIEASIDEFEIYKGPDGCVETGGLFSLKLAMERAGSAANEFRKRIRQYEDFA